MNYPSCIQINDKSFSVEYKKAFKATSSVKIKKGAVVVSLSNFLLGRKRDETVEKFLNWAKKRLEKVDHASFLLPKYDDGERIVTHNKVYELKVVFKDRSRSFAKLSDDFLIEIFLPDSAMNSPEKSKLIEQLAQKIIIKDQTAYLQEVIDELNELYFQERYNCVRFKRTKGRFGSCSSKRNINISFRLLFAPREVFRYVCVHELAHLKEMNHSKKFWELVKNALPDYKNHEKWLRESGMALG